MTRDAFLSSRRQALAGLAALPLLGCGGSGTAHSAARNSVVLRARLTLQPRLMKWLDSQPPAIEPTSEMR